MRKCVIELTDWIPFGAWHTANQGALHALSDTPHLGPLNLNVRHPCSFMDTVFNESFVTWISYTNCSIGFWSLNQSRFAVSIGRFAPSR